MAKKLRIQYDKPHSMFLFHYKKVGRIMICSTLVYEWIIQNKDFKVTFAPS